MKNTANTGGPAKMLPGISTACFYPQYTEQSLVALTKEPPQCVEVFINAAGELEPGYLKELRKIADNAGIRILSLHPYTSGLEPMYFFSGYDRRFQEGLEVYRRIFQAANLLGAEIVVFHGALRSVKMDHGFYFSRFEKVWNEALRHGVDLCQENVQRCTSFCPEFFLDMAHALPRVGYVLDVKQCVRAGVDIYTFAEAMGGRVRHLHISDHAPNQDCMVPGKGVLNIGKLLDIMRKNGFNGGAVVELYRENFGGIVEIYQGYQHLCTILSTMQ